MRSKSLSMIRQHSPVPASSAEVHERITAPSAQSSPNQEHGPDYRRILSALLRFTWLILLLAVLGAGAGFGAARMIQPVYKARVNVWVDVPDRYGGDRTDRSGPIRPGAMLEADDWVELVRSYIVLDQVVRDLRLYLGVKRPADRASFASFSAADDFRAGEFQLISSADGREYTLVSADGTELERGTVGDSVGRRLGFRWQPPRLPPNHTIDFSLAATRDASSGLGEQLDVRLDLNGNFLAIELHGTNPQLVANILNAVSQRYVEVAAQLKREKLTELTRILENQLNTARRNLDDAETAMQRFRTRTITLPSDQDGAGGAGEGGDPRRSSFFDVAADRDQLRRDREAIERFVTGDAGLATEALSAMEAVRDAPELSTALKELSDKQAQLRAYRYQYSEEYPPVQRLTREVAQLQQRTIPTLARALVAQLAARESELSRQVDAASSDLRGIPARTIEGVRLRRNAELKEQTYTQLQ